MVWAKLDDEILDNPKIVNAGVFGFALHIAGIAWCARNLTDGKIPAAKVRALLMLDRVNIDTANPLALIDGPRSMSGDEGLDALLVADHLVACGLWRTIAGGYEINDYLDYNPSREKVLAERARGAKRAKESHERKVFAKSSPEDAPKLRGDFAPSSDGPDPDPDPEEISHTRAAAPAGPQGARTLRPDEPLTPKRKSDFEGQIGTAVARPVEREWADFRDDRIKRSALFSSAEAIDADWRKWARNSPKFAAADREQVRKRANGGRPEQVRNLPHLRLEDIE